MKNVLLILLLFFSFGFAQDAEIVLIKSSKYEVLEFCRANKFAVYYLWENQAIVEINNKKELVIQNNIKFIPLCKSSQASNYSLLLFNSRTAFDPYKVSGFQIYADDRLQIIKKSVNAVRLELNNQQNYKILPLKDQPIQLPDITHFTPKKEDAVTEVSNVLSYINQDSLRSYVQHLQNYQTRFSKHPNRREIAFWIRNKFISFGITDAKVDSFYYEDYYNPGLWHYNVIATINGSENPEDIFILGGHHDSVVGFGTDPIVMTWAPGADDNASGTASVIESARAITQSGFISKKTLKFITFAFEEGAGAGSKHVAAEAVLANDKIKLMLNNDMIANYKSNAADWIADIVPHPGLNAYEQLAKQIFDSYTSLNSFIGCHDDFGYMGSDNAFFYLKGFPAQCFSESEFSPNWHKATDVIDSCNFPYATEIVKGTCAVLLMHSTFLPSRIDSLSLSDLNGKDVLLRWTKSNESNILNYKIYLGTATGTYTQTFTTTDTTIILHNLSSGIINYIGVTAINSAGREGVILEKSITPTINPSTPAQLQIQSGWQKLSLKWAKNHDLDFAGYNLYQSCNNTDYTKLNSTLIIDTVWQHNNPPHNSYNYYKVSAVDNDNNESELSESVSARPVTLNQGIMLIDESANGSGSLSSPDDSMQDQFFNSLLTNCPQVSCYDANISDKITLSELGPFSTVIWHNQSVELGSVFSRHHDEIKNYLDFGGKILITADKPGKLIESINTYPADCSSTSLAEQYFGIDSVNYRIPSRFSGAIPSATGFNYLTVDSSKTLSANGYHLKKLETLTAESGAEVIYLYDSKYDSNINYGFSKNQPVGILHSGTNFKTATLSIPLYFIKQNEAKKVVEYILKEKFGETVDIHTNQLISEKSLSLFQNYPNPFNNTTQISFALPNTGKAELAIFNAKGELVKELVNREMSAGKHSLEFKADNLNSGVYFYRLKFAGRTLENKLVLVK